MKRKMMKRKISITVDDEIVTEIKNICSDNNRNFSDFINSILVDWLKTRDYIQTSIPEILNGILDIKKYFEEFLLNELLNASSGSGTGSPERSTALPDKKNIQKKSS